MVIPPLKPAFKYRDALEKIVDKYAKEFKEAFDELEATATRLGLGPAYEKIWRTSTNPVADLRRWAEEHGLSEEYKKAMAKLPDYVRSELSLAYSDAWDDESVRKMREAGNKLKKAYKLIMRGDYEGAAAVAGIDVSRISGKPARDAMSIIASELGIGDEYSDIIGKRAGKKLKIRAELETTTK